MSDRQQFVRVRPDECQQIRHGKTPCYHAFSQRNVVCSHLCPVQLVREQNTAEIQRMFHNGTCLMDERNIASLGAQAKARTSDTPVEAVPHDLQDGDVIEDRTCFSRAHHLLSTSVTGPSFINVSSIIAPNSPVSTRETPSDSSLRTK